MNWPAIALLTLLAGMLCLAAWLDLRSRTIPNWLNAAIALAAPLWWLASGVDPWPGMVIEIAVAVLLFALFAGLFALGAMGGGDVKLIAAVALWLPFHAVVDMLMLMAVGGGVLTLVVLVIHRIRRRPGRPEVPYGVAIAGATLWFVANDILTALG